MKLRAQDGMKKAFTQQNMKYTHNTQHNGKRAQRKKKKEEEEERKKTTTTSSGKSP